MSLIVHTSTRSFLLLLAATLCCIVVPSFPMYAQNLESPSADHDAIFSVGEELIYNVSYASFDIGQIRITLVEAVNEGGRKVYKAVAHVDSYKLVPFVNLHTIFESTIDENVFAHWFRSRTKKEEEWEFVTYNFHYLEKKLILERGKWNNKSVGSRDTLALDTLYQDGLSLFYFARANVLRRQEVHIPSFVNESKGSTDITFNGEHTHDEIDAVKYPIDLVHFKGEAKFVGIFGLTGAFEGWFSNDTARIPIIATMKVLVGNVRLELMKWKRPNWNPPQYKAGNVK